MQQNLIIIFTQWKRFSTVIYCPFQSTWYNASLGETFLTIIFHTNYRETRNARISMAYKSYFPK